jgi:AcrR family transcriptional regulator
LNTFKYVYGGGMTRKSDRTRALLAETALRLFAEQGYEATTMRQIAAEAGVATGNAYYHFEGKDAFVQELYVRIQEEHREAALPRLHPGAALGENLAEALHAGLDVMTPHHGLGGVLLRSALPADSGLSPFSQASERPRGAAVGLMGEVASASKGTPGGRLGERLPHLLWLAHMGVTLFWVLDRSESQARTRTLVDGLAPLLGRLLTLLRLPGAGRLADDALDLMDRLEESPRPEGARR